MDEVEQYELLLLAAATDGNGLTTTVTEPFVAEVQPPTAWVTLYKPAIGTVTGFLVIELPVAPPPSGNVQLKMAPGCPVALSVSELPAQTGFCAAAATGAAGV